MKDLKVLIEKYNIPVPRYTSYPTVPVWQFNEEVVNQWPALVKETFNHTNSTKGISLYIHLPYCESLCTYCGCNQHITKNHAVEGDYIDSVLKEWKWYLSIFKEKPIIKEIHLGGGTPTFFSPKSLRKLLEGIYADATIPDNHEFSFEGHPNNTTYDHLKTLSELGFSRVSFGIQDFHEKVQVAINRLQPYQKVVEATNNARELGYSSVNYDLIYGLPFQNDNIIADTFNKVLELKPERIAYYSYAHVPWKRPGQRHYSEEDLPKGDTKRRLYDIGKSMLLDHGYVDIGMDHFAKPGDALYRAWSNKTMHRNFMGYTVFETELLIGLGMSSISEAGRAYVQNQKKVKDYQLAINNGKDLFVTGHILDQEDLLYKKIIKDIITKGEVSGIANQILNLPAHRKEALQTMQDEGILSLSNDGLTMTNPGMAFVRNVCLQFDQRYWANKDKQERFSRSI